MHTVLKRCFIALFLLAGLNYSANASHSTGQDMTYAYIGDSAGLQHYQVTFILYSDCINGNPDAIAQDNPAFLGLFDAASGSMLSLDTNVFSVYTDSMAITVSGPCDSGGTVLPVCNLQRIFVKNYYLAPSASGYLIAYQRCCLNGAISNILNAGNSGFTAFCIIPPSGIAATNNSALFKHYPPIVIANNYPLTFDCSATDADGDSLSYELCNTYNGANDPSNSKPIPAGPPYSAETYPAPLSYSNPVTCSVPMTLDPVTGQLTGTPDAIGRYLVEVCCNEWRHGVLINTTHREFQFVVANCPLPDTTVTPARCTAQITPNPASNVLTINTTCSIKSIVLFDAIGRKVQGPWNYQQALGGKYINTNATIDVSQLPNGNYFVKINGNIVKKFVKLRQ